MLIFNKVKKSYGNNVILNNISFKVPKGSIIGVIGANGAGKSTLLSIISTVIEDYDGEVLLDNLLIKKSLKDFRKLIGYVPQSHSLFEDLTLKDNIKFWHNNSSKEFVNRLIDILELQDSLKKKVKTLSGGTKSRVNILIGLINNPELIILDEPLVGVSLSIKKRFFEYIKELSKEGKIIFMSSHEIWEIEASCSDVLIIKNNIISVFSSIDKVKQICKKESIGMWDYLCREGGL